MKERNYENLTFRMISYGDFDEFKRACLASPEELTAFLSKGEFMEYYNLVDYINLFNAILKERNTNAYGLFEGSILVGFGTTSPASKSYGQQIVYCIRNGFHGKGYGVFLMHRLICRTIENGNSFASHRLFTRRWNTSIQSLDFNGWSRWPKQRVKWMGALSNWMDE